MKFKINQSLSSNTTKQCQTLSILKSLLSKIINESVNGLELSEISIIFLIYFLTSAQTGNLGKVDLISDFEYDLYIRPDTCNPYHRMWFNFVVDNTKLDQVN